MRQQLIKLYGERKMIGRNAPCHCGSGKKYKKCCLRKDRAAQSQKTAVTKDQDVSIVPAPVNIEPTPLLEFSAIDDSSPIPEVKEIDPLQERINAFWEKFMDAPYEKQWVAATKMLADEPELCDGEMVFEITNTLFGQAVTTGEMGRFKQLLDQLEVVVPDSYHQELAHILEWRIQMALIEEEEANLEQHFFQFGPLAGDKLDIYYRIISMLAYHGKLDILYQGMRQARPFVAEGADLVPWAYDEFTGKLADLDLIYLAAHYPDMTVNDPILQQHFAEYELTLIPEIVSHHLDYRSGRRTVALTLSDFALTKDKKKESQQNHSYLLTAYSHYATHEEGYALTKVWMFDEQLSRYLAQRRDGELGKSGSGHGRRSKKRHRRRKNKNQHPLCPDAQTLDQFMAQLMGFMSFQYYEACALFELTPAWLRFLIKHNLLDEETQQETIISLSYIKKHLIEIVDKQLSDPTMKENLVDWPYEP
ncbi:MAG: SEC-C domain-containing protein [Chloroflexi bacterium]|nr:SEC-C domain-containing protein [Chloroflexota bacterium]